LNTRWVLGTGTYPVFRIRKRFFTSLDPDIVPYTDRDPDFVNNTDPDPGKKPHFSREITNKKYFSTKKVGR